TQEWIRTFAIITTRSNNLIRTIHDRMPVIIPPIEYARSLSSFDPDHNDLLVPFPSDPMTMWPISTRVNKPANDDASILNCLPSQVGDVVEGLFNDFTVSRP